MWSWKYTWKKDFNLLTILIVVLLIPLGIYLLVREPPMLKIDIGTGHRAVCRVASPQADVEGWHVRNIGDEPWYCASSLDDTKVFCILFEEAPPEVCAQAIEEHRRDAIKREADYRKHMADSKKEQEENEKYMAEERVLERTRNDLMAQLLQKLSR